MVHGIIKNHTKELQNTIFIIIALLKVVKVKMGNILNLN